MKTLTILLSACALGVAAAQGRPVAGAPSAKERLEALCEDGTLFFNIAPFSPGEEKTVAEDMKSYVAQTGCRNVLYSLTLHPVGKPAMEKVEKALASYRALKEELRGSDVRLGILLQAILGHWPRTDKDVEPWCRTIDLAGDAKRFCWLDPGFRAYIKEVGRRLAAEGPCFILGDDDIRAFSPRAECFCPRHVAEFNRRLGTNYDCAAMRAAVKASKPGDRVFQAFRDLQREQVDGVCALIREGIDEVDPTIPAGTCMSGWENRFNHTAARAIAAKGQPTLMRFANGNYHERNTSPNRFIAILQKTQSHWAFHKDNADILLAEADTYPHHLWSRSSVSWNAHLTTCMFTGLKGAKLWLVNAHKFGYPVSRNYTETLAANARIYGTLAKEIEKSKPIGLIEPCLVRFPNWHPSKARGDYMTPDTTWATVVLGRFGIPFTSSKDYRQDGVWTLSGRESVSRLTDDDLKAILSHKVLVDGTAACALTERGMGGLIGATAEKGDVMFNGELDAESGAVVPLTRSDNVPRIKAAPGAKVLTHLTYAAYKGAADLELVQPGVTLFDNELGGRVAVTAFHLGISGDRICGEARKAWLEKVIDSLTGGHALPFVENPQDVTALAARSKEGAVLLAVVNLNYDPMKNLRVRPSAPFSSVELLKGDGKWHAVPYSRDGSVVELSHQLPCYGTAILRFR